MHPRIASPSHVRVFLLALVLLSLQSCVTAALWGSLGDDLAQVSRTEQVVVSVQRADYGHDDDGAWLLLTLSPEDLEGLPEPWRCNPLCLEPAKSDTKLLDVLEGLPSGWRIKTIRIKVGTESRFGHTGKRPVVSMKVSGRLDASSYVRLIQEDQVPEWVKNIQSGTDLRTSSVQAYAEAVLRFVGACKPLELSSNAVSWWEPLAWVREDGSKIPRKQVEELMLLSATASRARRDSLLKGISLVGRTRLARGLLYKTVPLSALLFQVTVSRTRDAGSLKWAFAEAWSLSPPHPRRGRGTSRLVHALTELQWAHTMITKPKARNDLGSIALRVLATPFTLAIDAVIIGTYGGIWLMLDSLESDDDESPDCKKK